jgi:hypothetical protein
MPLVLPPTFGQVQISHFTASASGRDPITVTAGNAAHTKGAWIQLIASTPYDAYGIWVSIEGLSANNTNTAYLVDIGVGPAGSEQVVLPNLDAWGADSTGWAIRLYWFPVYIPAGSRIAARGQSVTASKTCRVMVALDGVPWYGLWGVGPVVDYGTNLTISAGTSITPAQNAFGTWTQIGTTTRDHTFWAVGVDLLDRSTTGNNVYLVEIGVGPSGSQRSLGFYRIRVSTAETFSTPFPLFISSLPVPSGTAVWARAAAAETYNIGVIVYAA